MSYIGKGVEVVTFNTATTLDVAGNITVGGTVDGRDVATDGTKLDTIAANAIANLSEDTTPQLGGNLDLNTSNVIGTGNINVTGSITGTSFVSTGDMSFTNNSKAIFGTSPSLEIYHDGSNSILDDVGAGNFKMQLAGADKLEITSTGVDVTGTVTATAFSGDGSALTGITIPTLSSLGIANHDQVTVDGSGNVDVTGTLSANNIRVGVALDSWGANSHVLQMGDAATDTGALAWNTVSGADYFDLMYQSYFDGTNYKYATSAAASRISQRNGNITFDRKAAGTADATFTWDNSLIIDYTGNVGIGTNSPTAPLTILSNGWEHLNLVSSDADAANKTGYVTVGHYTNAQESFGIISGQSTTSSNILNIGGGAAGLNAATSINFYTAANNTTVTGTQRLTINASGNVGIGTVSPISVSSTNLTISGSASSSLFLEDTGYEASGLGLFSLTYDDGNLKFETANRSGAGRTGNTETMRIDSSGNLLVGKLSSNSISVGVEIRDGTSGYTATFTGNDAANSVLSVMRNNGDGEFLRLRNSSGTTVGNIGTSSGSLSITATGSPFIAGTSSQSVGLRMNSSSSVPAIIPVNNANTIQNGSIDLGFNSGRFKDLWLSGGVVFGATGGAVTSKTLDDYEEGTWTGTLKGLTSNPTTPVTATGEYTKVGRKVYAEIRFSNVSNVGASGNVYVSGLPFTVNTPFAASGNCAAYLFDFPSGLTSLSVQVSGTNLFPYISGDSTTWDVLKHAPGTARYLEISAQYTVA
jgi:hypothetical protein